jgi:hypothetical protein
MNIKYNTPASPPSIKICTGFSVLRAGFLVHHKCRHVLNHKKVASVQVRLPFRYRILPGDGIVGSFRNLKVRDLAACPLSPITVDADEVVELVERTVLEDADIRLIAALGG